MRSSTNDYGASTFYNQGTASVSLEPARPLPQRLRGLPPHLPEPRRRLLVLYLPEKPIIGLVCKHLPFEENSINSNLSLVPSGDSYTQTGFTPNGTLPAFGNPLGNPPYPGWTSTGGENWLDYATVAYNRSMLFTYNYAYGGATIDATLVPPYTPTVLSVTDQVNQFLTSVANKPASTPWTSANALFSIWIGINDLGNSYYLSGDRAAYSSSFRGQGKCLPLVSLD